MNHTLLHQYLQELDWNVKENSNMSFSLQGLNNYASTEITKEFWLGEIYPHHIAHAHRSGDLHIHDLGLLAPYCVGWDLLDLIMTGFTGVQGKTSSKPPNHFRSALGQIVNFFYTLQGEAAGAQAFSSFDTLLAPFIRYDQLSYTETKQALQEFVFNLNIATRVGFQTPFTNLTLDLEVPKAYKSYSVIRGGQAQSEVYGDFQEEMNTLNRALLEVMSEGDAHERVFTFPILTYNITKDFHWDNPDLEPLWEATARYGLPYFSNFINSDLNPEDARSMCCRLRLETKDLEMKGGGLFGANPLTGSIGIVTINIPRIAYLTTTKEEFFYLLNQRMDDAYESLEIKRTTIETYTEKGLYPYTKFYLRKIFEETGKYWANHFSTIGLIGLNEACANFLNTDISTSHGQQFALDVLQHMKERLHTYSQRSGHNYNLEATPAEGTTYRLAKADTELYPEIITAGEHEVYYTNSSHLPVNYSQDIFEVLDLQDDLQTQYTGGTVMHLFLGERAPDGAIIKTLVKTICEHYRLPYFTFTPSFSICSEHGYINGEQSSCPQCGQETEIYSRVVGYLRPIKQWNTGKKQEFQERSHLKLT